MQIRMLPDDPWAFIYRPRKKNIQHYETSFVHVQLQLQKCTYNQTLIRIISTIIIAIIRTAFLLFIIVQNYKIWCRIAP